MARIEAVEVFRVNLPLRNPMKLASDVSTWRRTCWWHHLLGGVAGWGEAAPHRP